MSAANEIIDIANYIDSMLDNLKLPGIMVQRLLVLLAEYKLEDESEPLFEENHPGIYELVALLTEVGILDEYSFIFAPYIVENYSKLDKQPILHSDVSSYINIYNINKYYDKFYNSLLPKYQKVLAGLSSSDVYVVRGLYEDSCKTILRYVKNNRSKILTLNHLTSFKIVDEMGVCASEVGRDYYNKFIPKNKVILVKMNIFYMTVKNMETMYKYSVEQGFDTSLFEIDSSLDKMATLEHEKILTEASKLSNEFYQFLFDAIYSQFPI